MFREKILAVVRVEFAEPVTVNLTAASSHEPDLVTINFGSASEFPLNRLENLKKGSIVTIYTRLPKSRVLWPWSFRVNRQGQSMASRHKPAGWQVAFSPSVGDPVTIEIVSMDITASTV